MIYTKEKRLLKLVEKFYKNNGEIPDNRIHVLNHTDEYPVFEDEKKYRVYVSDGNCFDIEVCRNYDSSERGEYDEIEQWWNFDSWDSRDGFKPITVDEAINLFK